MKAYRKQRGGSNEVWRSLWPLGTLLASVFTYFFKIILCAVNLGPTPGTQGVRKPPIFLVSFERGRRGADRAAASAFVFPKGAAGSSFSRTCFLIEKNSSATTTTPVFSCAVNVAKTETESLFRGLGITRKGLCYVSIGVDGPTKTTRLCAAATRSHRAARFAALACAPAAWSRRRPPTQWRLRHEGSAR